MHDEMHEKKNTEIVVTDNNNKNEPCAHRYISDRPNPSGSELRNGME